MIEKKSVGRPKKWPLGSPQERSLREHYPNKGAAFVAEMLGMTPREVTDGAKMLGVRRNIQPGERSPRKWTKERLEVARAVVWEHGIAAAARILGERQHALAHAVERYGLMVSPEAKRAAIAIGLAAAKTARLGRAATTEKPKPKDRTGPSYETEIPAGPRHSRYMKARVQRADDPIPRVSSVFGLAEVLNA